MTAHAKARKKEGSWVFMGVFGRVSLEGCYTFAGSFQSTTMVQIGVSANSMEKNG